MSGQFQLTDLRAGPERQRKGWIVVVVAVAAAVGVVVVVVVVVGRLWQMTEICSVQDVYAAERDEIPPGYQKGTFSCLRAFTPVGS